MSTNSLSGSHIIIVDDIEVASNALKARLKPHRTVLFQPDEVNFKIEVSKAVIAEAYIAEEDVKYLILSAKMFTTEAQNALLKIIEEPPRNIEIIIITESKSVLLPTVRSRLKIVQEKIKQEKVVLDLNLATLSLSELVTFVKAHERLGKSEAKVLLEGLYYRATAIDKIAMSERQIEGFARSYHLLEVNARFQTIVVTLLMGFLKVTRGR